MQKFKSICNHSVSHHAAEMPLKWHFMVSYCILRPFIALYGFQAWLNQNNFHDTLKKVCPKPQCPFLPRYQVNTVLYERVTPIKY